METDNDNTKSNINAAIMGGLVVLGLLGVMGLIHWSGKEKSKNLSGSKGKRKKK